MDKTEEDGAQQPEPRADESRVVWVVIVALIVVLGLAGTIMGSSSSTTVQSSSIIVQGTRAVIVPTADAARTVVIAPCGTGAAVLSANATAIMNTTGATSVELPQGEGVRVVLVPKCSGGHGGASGTSSLPSAAFVLRPGTSLPSAGPAQSASSTQVAAPESAQFELTLPSGSPIRTIVVSPCEKAQGSGPAHRILSVAGSSTTAVAPPC